MSRRGLCKVDDHNQLLQRHSRRHGFTRAVRHMDVALRFHGAEPRPWSGKGKAGFRLTPPARPPVPSLKDIHSRGPIRTPLRLCFAEVWRRFLGCVSRLVTARPTLYKTRFRTFLPGFIAGPQGA